VTYIICAFISGILELKGHLSNDKDFQRIMNFMYLGSQEELDTFSSWIYSLRKPKVQGKPCHPSHHILIIQLNVIQHGGTTKSRTSGSYLPSSSAFQKSHPKTGTVFRRQPMLVRDNTIGQTSIPEYNTLYWKRSWRMSQPLQSIKLFLIKVQTFQCARVWWAHSCRNSVFVDIWHPQKHKKWCIYTNATQRYPSKFS